MASNDASVLNRNDTSITIIPDLTQCSLFMYDTIRISLEEAAGAMLSIPAWASFTYSMIFDRTQTPTFDEKVAADYTIEVNSSTVGQYFYFAESNPDFDGSYSLGLVTSAVSYHEEHKSHAVNVVEQETMDFVQNIHRSWTDGYFNDAEYAWSVYRAGGGYEFRGPLDAVYDFRTAHVGNFYPKQPLTDAFLYSVIG